MKDKCYFCFGDSLTYGSVGVSYIKYLRRCKIGLIKNRGVNGDTTVCMFQRLKAHISKSSSNDKNATYIICIGTNDLLLPYLTTISKLWKAQIIPRIKMMQCLKDDKLYSEKLEEIIKYVILNNKKLILIGLPYLELYNYPNKLVEDRNYIIEELARKNNIPYIDITSIQRKFGSRSINKYSWKYKNLLRFLEGIILPILPWMKNYLSRRRNLSFTVDGVHWNSEFAELISDKIEQFL